MHVNAEMTRHTRIIIDYEFEGSMQGSIISVLSAFLLMLSNSSFANRGVLFPILP